jgi:hypothetical protein
LMAGATAGGESAEWRRAAQWLARVERDAHQAEQKAQAAVELASRQCTRDALKRVEEACRLEAKYHKELVWQPLQEAIAGYAYFRR